MQFILQNAWNEKWCAIELYVYTVQMFWLVLLEMCVNWYWILSVTSTIWRVRTMERRENVQYNFVIIISFSLNNFVNSRPWNYFLNGFQNENGKRRALWRRLELQLEQRPFPSPLKPILERDFNIFSQRLLCTTQVICLLFTVELITIQGQTIVVLCYIGWCLKQTKSVIDFWMKTAIHKQKIICRMASQK